MQENQIVHTSHASHGPLKDQYSDFLLRSQDPYARAKYNILHSWLDELQNKRVLIVGAGSGEFACELALKGAKVLATDIDEQSLELCRQTALQYKAPLEFQVAKLDEIPFPQSTPGYDLIVATDVIEHIENDKAASEKLLGLCKPGGKLLITVPSLNMLFGYHDEILGHFRRYNSANLEKLFKKQTKTLRLRYFGFFLIPVTFYFSVWKRKPYPVAETHKKMNSPSLSGKILDFIFKLETRFSFGSGTSLLALFEKN